MDVNRRLLLRRTALVGVGLLGYSPSWAQETKSSETHSVAGVTEHGDRFAADESARATALTMELAARSAWWAASGAIGHQRGRVHSNGRHWSDPCTDTSPSRWTCYGPYTNLPRGTYKATWYFDAERRDGQGAVSTDAVGLVGAYPILPEKIYTVPSDGAFFIERTFTLHSDVDNVEYRLRSHAGCKLLIAKELVIEEE